ncbi:MAG TPA: methyltransferase domain-containing protein [Thermoanaerobaculia bacterium]|nr:methyltransferase domain-containing protein [Thermoanaerobaculia bacterium]
MIDFSDPQIVSAYDELPLWSAMFGLLLLDEVPLAEVGVALDVGCGTGFPLIELAERLGPHAHVHGIDPWHAALERATAKIAARATPNVTLHEGSASKMPFDDGTFDLIVSNLGINNFDDRLAAMRECRRVARPGATIALTTNLQGHMRELYEVFEEVLRERGDDVAKLRAHISHRPTVAEVHELLEGSGFEVTRVVERTAHMRFANGTALFNHHFIKLGFLDAWKELADADVIGQLEQRLNRELSLTIPMAYVEAATTPSSR